jgi:hypothetical protein
MRLEDSFLKSNFMQLIVFCCFNYLKFVILMLVKWRAMFAGGVRARANSISITKCHRLYACTQTFPSEVSHAARNREERENEPVVTIVFSLGNLCEFCAGRER